MLNNVPRLFFPYIGALLVVSIVLCFDAESVAVEPPAANKRVMRTPKPGPEPRINGPRLFGARPGRPFLYRIPCTGTRPMTFAVDDLPEGLRIDSESGIIAGRVPKKAGNYKLTLKAKNQLGVAEKQFTLVVGDTLSLTPPM
ncbi:unnamed protein product, partial [marine sediment metagenome]